MLHQPVLRRQGFRQGPRIRLADGQEWIFPSPPDRPHGEVEATLAAISPPHDPDEEAMITAFLEADDEAECLRAELALAILLLASNYDLAPANYVALLDYPPDDPALATVQRAFHDLAMDYVRACRPRADGRVATSDLSSTLPDRKTGFDVPIGRAFRGWAWRGATAVTYLPRILRSILSARRAIRSERTAF